MTSVTLEGVRKIYPERAGQQVAVRDLDLVIHDGEFLVLVGPSGCGKSTTLRMIAGLESISAGTLRIGDVVANDIPARDRDIAMVFQSYALYPHMSVRENLGFALRLRKMPSAEIASRVEGAAAKLGITALLDRKPRQLSGGERQRVALGRAIVRQPQAFLFDEPLSNLDAKLRVQMRREIHRLHLELGTTMIYVTHDQVEAMTLGDRIAVMSAGELQQVDTPLGLYARPANLFVASFIGSPPMNLLPGAIIAGDRGHQFTADGTGWPPIPTVDGAPAEGRVVLGLRPEAIDVSSEAGLPVRLDLLEPLGNETLLHVTAGSLTMVVRAQGTLETPAGSTLYLRPEWPAAHWFAEGDGRRLADR